MGGKAHHPSSSESDDWGDESWIVACPCGVNFDDGEEMVECDKCCVWVHTHCCRVPKGLTTFVCDKCKSKKKKQQELEEVAEVTQVLETLGHQVEVFASSEQQQHQTTTTTTSAHEMLSEERAHVHGIPGGDARMFVGVSKVFSQQLWKFTGYVPKVLHIESNELAPWPYEDGFSHLLPDSSSSPQHKLENENTMEKHEDEETEKNHKDVKPLPDHTATTISHKDKHGRRGGSGGDGKRGGEGKHCKHRPKQQQQQQQQQHQRGSNKEERSHCHGKRAGDESSHKDHSVKKRARIGGDGGKATDEEQLQQQQHSKKGGDGLISEVAGIVGSVASLKSPLTSPKNPKAMKKMAVQEFMDGGILVCSQCAKIEQVSCREAHGSGGGPELFLCQECAKLRDLPLSEPELREGPSCLASSMPITEEARAKGAAGSNSGCKDPKQIDPRETWDVSRSKKLKDEMEQLGCSTKSEFLGRNGRPGENYKAAMVEGSHAERDNNAGGSTATTLPTAVQDEKATVCQRERESQPKEVLEVMPGGETNNSPVSEPVFLRVDMPETHIEAASGQEVRKEGEQAASPRQLHDSTKVSPKLSTPIVGTSAPSVTSSTLASSKMFSNTGWGLGSARAISVPFSTPLHMPETAASGHTLNAKAKADDHVQNQNSLTIASLSYKGGDVPAPGCGGEVSLPADFASSPHQQVLPSAGNPVGPLQETVLDLQMERPDTLPLQKSPLFAEATPSRETLSHTPTIDTDLVEDMSADPPNSRLSEMASCKAAEHKQFNLEHGGHGSACTLGRFPLSSEEVALGEQSVQQQRQQQGSGPLNQQHLPAYPERLGLPVGSDESEPARTTSGADETTLSEMQKNLQPQVTKFMMSGHPSYLSSLSNNNNNNKNPPPLSSKSLPSTFGQQQEPEEQLHSISQSSAPVGQSSNLEPTTSSVSHTHFPEQPGQSGQRTQNAVVDLNPSSPSLPPVCQQARQSSGHHVHVVSSSQQPTNSSVSEPHSASTGGDKPPGPGSGLVPKNAGTPGPKFPSSGALSSSPSSPPSSKPQQTVSSSSPCSPPSQWTTPGVSSRPPHPVLSGRPSSGGTTSSTTALNSKLPSGALHSHKSGPLASASSVPIKPPNISKVPTRAISLPSKLNDVSTSLTKPSKAVGVRTSSQGPLPSGLSVKENSKHPASLVLKAPTSAKPSLQSSSVKHMTSISKSSHSHSSKTLSSQTSSTKQVPSLMSTPSKSTSVGQVSKNTATTPLKPGLVSTSHKEEKCGLNAAPLPSKSTLTMPPPPPPTAVKRVTPAIATSQATSVTTMNDEELALKLHQELNSSPRVPRLPRVRHTNTTHQLTSSSQSLTVTPAKRSASAMTTPAGSSQKDHHLVPRKRLREDRSKDNFRSSSGNMDEGGKVSGVSPPVSFSRRHEDSGRTEEAPFLKVKSRSGSPDSESSKEKAVAIPFSAHSSGEGVARHSSFPRGKLSIIVPQGTDDSSDSAEPKSPADGGHLSAPGVIDEGTRGPISSVATVEAAPPHVQRLRKVNGEPYLHSGHRQVSVDTLQKRTLSSHHPDHRTNKVQPPSSRRRRWTGPSGLTESEEDDETEGGASPPHHHDGIEKGKFEKHRRDYYGGDATDEDDDPPRHKDSVATREDVPKGKRKARRRRLLAVDEGHDGIRGKRKVSKTVRKSEVHEKVASTVGQEEEPDAPSSPSSEEVVSNYSEEDEEMVVRRGIRSRHRRGEGDSSGGEDYEGD